MGGGGGGWMGGRTLSENDVTREANIFLFESALLGFGGETFRAWRGGEGSKGRGGKEGVFRTTNAIRELRLHLSRPR